MMEKELNSTELPIKVERILNSEELFQGSRSLLINHQGALYRLLITKQGKLVLNK